MQLRTVIIDDEQNNINNLAALLRQHCPAADVIATALNAAEGEKIILQCVPDIIFLDIQMPGKNGFELLKALPAHSFEVIFVTAYDQYGIQAVKFSAVDYLLKPVNADELKQAVQKAVERVNSKKQNLLLQNLIETLQKQHNREEHRIALSTLKETRFINPQHIVRCESTNNYTTFFLESGETLLVSKPIYEYEELLHEYGFIRCHQTHLINKKFIKSYTKTDGGYLLLTENTQLPVSKTKREFIKQKLSSVP